MEQILLDFSSLKRALDQATQVALDAGSLLLNYLEDPKLMQFRERADLEVERLIRAHLCTAFPEWGFRAEEEPKLNKTFNDERPFWLVDPNDGTSAFLRGERGASVSIALIFQRRPVLGVIFAYAAPNAKGDLFTWAESCDPLRRNGQVLNTRWVERWKDSIHLVSNSADQIAEAYKTVLIQPELDQAHYRIAPGIAYRLALCAAGEGETAVSLASPRDFDFAAGHALLKGAGGELFDENGQTISYCHSKPTRLARAFGGYSPLAQKLSHFDWSPVLLAKRQHKNNDDLPFLKPQEMKLSRSKQHVDQIQGAWWGWHYGHLLYKYKLSAQDSEQIFHLATTKGGDVNLVQETRLFINGQSNLDQSQYLKVFLDLFLNNQSGAQLGHVQKVIDAKTGALWGAELGRQQLNHRMVSAFLAYRQGVLNHWLVDGDRLAEQLLSLVNKIPNVH